MRTKRVYRIGIIVIIVGCLLNPLSYLLFGQITDGKVVALYTNYRKNSSNFTPIISFCKDSQEITFAGRENSGHNYGDTVKIVYYSFNPHKAKILSFNGLLLWPIIELATCQFIWWAFLSSFNNIFDQPPFKRN
jgi:hypothetical protein